MRETICRNQNSASLRWPIYLTIKLPDCSPEEWRGIIGSRLMSVLLPQLQACGFFPRPLCVDRPAYMLLLWVGCHICCDVTFHSRPVDCVWTNQSYLEFTLPLEDRILPCLFAMLETAYNTLWDAQTERPPLSTLLPQLDIHLSDL